MRVILPHTLVPGTSLEVARARTGREIHRELAGLGVAGLPSGEAFASTALWPNGHRSHVSAQFFVRDTGADAPVGYVSLHELSPHSGYVKCSVAVDASAAEGVRAAATLLPVNYAFAMWNIRKVYFWTPEPGVPGLGAAGADATREGTLPEHLLQGGELRAVHIFALYRRQWEESGVEFVAGLAAGNGAGRGRE